MNNLKKYWFLIVFVLGFIGTVYTLQADQKVANETIKDIKEEVKEKSKDIKENEKTDMQQTIILEKMSVVQEQLIKAVDKLNAKIEKGG